MTKNPDSPNTGPRTSVIVHPPELPMRITREDYLVICCGDGCAADLLNVFEHWANSKGKATWIYRSAEGLREDLLLRHSPKSIRNSLQSLIEWGYIERRNNPNVGFDRKYQYRLLIENIHAAIWYFYRMDAANLPNALGKNTEAIKETQKEIQKKTISASGKRSKAELDEFFELICKGSFGKASAEIGKQRVRVGKIRKELFEAIPDLTVEELRSAYILYAQKNDDIWNNPEKRLKSIETISDWIQQATDAKKIHAPRESQKWQANQELYDAYAEEFSDRYTDEDILALDIAVLQTWWTNR